ncbi:MAG: MFS transporter [Firmicutes bacterium]|nr:MFS transporter [Bacillota bacterium]
MNFKTKRILVLLVIVLAYWISFFNRSLTTPTLPLLIKDWGMTMAGAGAIASIMLFTYSLGHIPFGILADKFGRSKFMLLGTAVVGVANFLMSLTTSFSSFLGLRAFVGLGAAANHAPLMAMVTDWFPAKRRGLAMGVLAIVSTAGPLTALLWGQFAIGKWGGWQPVYAYTIVPAVVIVVLALLFAKDPNAEDKKRIHEEELQDEKEYGVSPKIEQSHHVPWTTILKTSIAHKELWVLYISWFFIMSEFTILLHFLPTMLVKLRGVPVTDAIFMTTGWLWTGLVVSILGGWLSDRFKSRKWFTFFGVIPAHIIVMAIPFIPVSMIFPMLCVMGVFWFGTSGAYYTLSADVCGRANPALMATLLGISIVFADLGGVFGAQISGYLGDKLGVGSMFWVAGIIGILFCLSLLFLPETAKKSAKA